MDKDGSIAPDALQRNAADEAPLKLEEFLPYRLNVAALASQALSRIYAERYGINVAEWRVLTTLGQYGAMTGKAVGAHSHMHKTKVSRAVAQLEKRKLPHAAPTRLICARRSCHRRRRPAGPSSKTSRRSATTFADRFVEAIDPADRDAFDRALKALAERAKKLTI